MTQVEQLNTWFEEMHPEDQEILMEFAQHRAIAERMRLIVDSLPAGDAPFGDGAR